MTDMIYKPSLSYDDVLLVPKYSDITSRKEVDISSELDKNRLLQLPIISSPMDTITESSMANSMASSGGLGVIHRYNSLEIQVEHIRQVKDDSRRAAAIGITGDYLDRAHALYDVGVRILCLDVAHGHHILMQKAIDNIKSAYPDVHLMAGNVATKSGFESLARWGADSIRCNIGGGSICSTRIQTGHGVPGLQTIFDCLRAEVDRDVKIIADGGIKNSGDIVKALAAGADFVMVGSLLAGTHQTPGDIIYSTDGSRRKIYRGMASKEAQNSWRGTYSSNEGISTTVPARGDVSDILSDLESGIRSGLSYSGARNIMELQVNSEFIIQSGSGRVESGTHILSRS